jgi:hypothetical protein
METEVAVGLALDGEVVTEAVEEQEVAHEVSLVFTTL